MNKFSGEDNRRKYFRIDLDTPLCTEMTIVEVKGKKIKTSITNVCVIDIGAGGLAFTSKLNFPIGKEVIFRFNTTIFKESISFIGNIIRRTEIRDGIYKYGVQFILDEQTETEYIKIFNRLLIALKKDWRNIEYSSCKGSKCRNVENASV
ncbi:MAG: PilZ domain-containing protein [Bacillota bacterium]|nr:PilZ domain-containing protein [Bacillota bacterium]